MTLVAIPTSRQQTPVPATQPACAASALAIVARPTRQARWAWRGVLCWLAVAALLVGCVVYPAASAVVAPASRPAGEPAVAPQAELAADAVADAGLAADDLGTGAASDLVGLALGENHTCTLSRAGVIECWGYNKDGALGIGSGAAVARGVVIGVIAPGDTVSVRAIAAGGYQTCALRSDGVVLCWGLNHSKQAGATDARVITRPTPVNGLPPIRALALGDAISCAISVDGGAWCWGSNESSGIDDGPRRVVATPVRLRISGPVEQLAVGNHHLCALAKGRVTCTGKLAQHARELAALQRVTALSAGWEHSCAIASGRVVCWGSNYLGVLGFDDRCGAAKPKGGATPAVDDDERDSSRPDMYRREDNHNQVEERMDTERTVLIGKQPGCAAAKSERYPPRPVAGLPSRAAVSLSGHDYHTCAKLDDGAAVCWGNNQGHSFSTERAAEPYAGADHLPSLSPADRLLAGGVHTCALRAGTVRCVGNDWSGAVTGVASQR